MVKVEKNHREQVQMSQRKKDPLLEALEEGKTYTWTVPDGGTGPAKTAESERGCNECGFNSLI
jgi:hypothetical protein